MVRPKDDQRLIAFEDFSSASSVWVLIIADDFKTHTFYKERSCNAPDLQRLRKTFGTQRKCIVRELLNKHSSEILSMVRGEDSLTKLFSPCDDAPAALVVFVLSHGDEKEQIFTSHEGDIYRTADLWNGLEGQKALKGVLKVFFFGPCRGLNDEIKNHMPPLSDSSSSSSVSLRSTWISAQPNLEDYVILYSTVETTAANTNSEGSWFVTSICDVLDTLKEDCDSSVVWTRVKNLIGGTSSLSDSMCQTPQEHCLPHRPFKILKSEMKHEKDGKADVENIVEEERSVHYTWKADTGLPLRRGLALMFSNHKASAKADEFSTNFRALDFYVRKMDLQNVEDDLRKVSGSCGLREDGCLVVCILAELEEDENGLCVHTEDSKKVPLSALIQNFIGSRCPELASKPKLFFFLDNGDRTDAAKEKMVQLKPEDWNIAGNNHSGILAFVCSTKATIDNLLCALQSPSLRDGTTSLQQVLTDVICKERSTCENPKIKAQLSSTLQYVVDFLPCRNRYIKPKFKNRKDNNKVLPFETVLEGIESEITTKKQLGNISAWVLVAPAGMGKSAATDQFAKELHLKKGLGFLVVPIKLRDHYEFFRDLKEENEEKPDCVKLLKKVVANGEELEAAVKEYKVFVFLDGFDEICPTYKDLALGFIADFQRRGIRMWISTRPHKEKSVREMVAGIVETLELLPMETAEQIEMLKTLLYRDDEDCHEILKVFEKEKNGNLNGTPLQLKMLAELVANKITFKDETLTEFYYRFVQMKIEKAMFTTNRTTRGLPGFQKMFCEKLALLIKAAVVHLLIDVVPNSELTNYSIEYDADIDDANQLGLMTAEKMKDGDMWVQSFMHRTYAEFLISLLMLKKMGHFLEASERKFKSLDLTKAFLVNELPQVRLFVDTYFSGENAESKLKISRFENCFSIESLKTEQVALMAYVCKEGLKQLFRVFFEILKIEELTAILNKPFTYTDPSRAKKISYYPIQSACMYSEDWALSLVEKGADIRLLDPSVCIIEDEKNILHYAAERDFVRILEAAKERIPHDVVARFDWNFSNNPLKVAATMGHLKSVENLLGWIEDDAEKFKQTNRTLEVAAQHGHFHIIKYFVELGAVIPDQGVYLLHTACSKGQIQLVPKLIELGFGVNVFNNYAKTPLDYAAEYGHFEIMECLIENGADANLKDAKGRVTLHRCMSFYISAEVVNYLIDHGADVNCSDDNGDTPLHWVAAHHDVELTKLLISRQACIDKRNKAGWLPMHRAVVHHDNNGSENKYALFRFYLEKKPSAADMNLAWKIALRYGISEVVQMFLEKYGFSACTPVGIKPPIIIVAENALEIITLDNDETFNEQRIKELNEHFETQQAIYKSLLAKPLRDEYPQHKITSAPFSHSETRPITQPTMIQDRSAKCMKILVQHGADVKQFYHSVKKSALCAAVIAGNLPCVQFLLNEGAQMNCFNHMKLAIENDRWHIVEYFVSRGVDVNLQDGNGYSALHLAAIQGSSKIIFMLLRAGSDPQLRTKMNSQKALHLSASHGHLECFKILLQAEDEATRGAEVHAAFCRAVLDEDLVFMKALVDECGARPVTQFDRSPLRISLMTNRVELVEFILKNMGEAEAALEATKFVSMAVKNRNENILRVLVDAGADLSNVTDE